MDNTLKPAGVSATGGPALPDMSLFFSVFLPLFAAMDPFGIFPLFVASTRDLSGRAVRRLALQATLTALGVGLVFLFAGKAFLALLGISIEDMLVAGGILLLVIAIQDMTSGEKPQRKIRSPYFGVVPIGVPLIVGPGVMTTLLTLSQRFSLPMVFLGFFTNVFLVFLLLYFSQPLTRRIGTAAAEILSKILMIFLAAIGVSMIRAGLG